MEPGSRAERAKSRRQDFLGIHTTIDINPRIQTDATSCAQREISTYCM